MKKIQKDTESIFMFSVKVVKGVRGINKSGAIKDFFNWANGNKVLLNELPKITKYKL